MKTILFKLIKVRPERSIIVKADPAIINANLIANNPIPVFPDEDFAFFATGQEIPEFVDEMIELFIKHSKIFYIILTMQFVLDIIFNMLTFHFRAETFKDVMNKLKK